MKTSKIIFISLVGTIALIILAGFIDLRISGIRNGIHPGKNIMKQTIPSFRVLYVNGSNIELIQDDSAGIEIQSMEEFLSPKLNYKIKEDTLMISDINTKDKNNNHINVRIKSTDSLKSILLKNSYLTVQRIVAGKISLDMDKSIVWFNQDKSYFRILEILAKNHSQINSSAFRVDTLGIFLNNSYARFDVASKKLYGSLSDSSTLRARQAEMISLVRDSTSKINLNDY